MGIATYNTEAEFEESNKWMIPILNEVAQSLSAKFESLSGQEIISYEKTDQYREAKEKFEYAKDKEYVQLFAAFIYIK